MGNVRPGVAGVTSVGLGGDEKSTQHQCGLYDPRSYTETEFLGKRFWISRQGTDGDFERAIQMYQEYDGKVDAFGVGGTEFYQVVAGRRYYWRDARRIRRPGLLFS